MGAIEREPRVQLEEPGREDGSESERDSNPYGIRTRPPVWAAGTSRGFDSRYLDSWVDELDLKRCFQLMEIEGTSLFDE